MPSLRIQAGYWPDSQGNIKLCKSKTIIVIVELITKIAFVAKIAINDVNRTLNRALRILCSDFTSSFEVLLLKANECAIHRRNLPKVNFRGL